MAYHDRDYLFAEYDLGETLRRQISAAKKAVDAIPEQRFSSATDEEIAAGIAHDLQIQPLELLESERTMRREETQVDVSGNWDRNPFRDRGPINVAGVRVVISVPFRGDPMLWKMKPSTWQSTFPRARVRAQGNEGGMLEIEYTKPADEDNERLKQFIESTFKDIRFYVGNQKGQIEQELSNLPRAISEAIQRRRERLRAHDDLSSVLGIPMTVAPAATAAPAAVTSRPAAATAAQPAQVPATWDLFLSHASEDKDAIARPLAQALQKAGFSVWFDEMTLRVGDSLRRSIDQGLAKSRFGIVVISPAFLRKEWPQRELDGLVAREVRGKKVILPVWHQVDVTMVTEYSPTLADRVAARTDGGLDRVVQAIKDAMK